MCARVRSVTDFPFLYAAIVWSRTLRDSTAEERRLLTMVSRYESYAWRIEMGRLSSELGLSIRTLPQVLSWLGRVRVARMMGVRDWRRSVQMGWRRARILRLKLCRRAFDCDGWMMCMRLVMVPLKARVWVTGVMVW